MRKILAAGTLLALVLAACSSNTGTTGSTTPLATPTPGMSSGSADVCATAFGDLSAQAIADIGSQITTQTNAGDQLDNTIKVCNTLDNWKAAARQYLPNVDLSGAQDFIKARCQASSTLQGTELCTAVGA